MPVKSTYTALKFPMQPRAKNVNRPTVAVKCRIADELVIQGGMNRFPDLKVIIRFNNVLLAVGEISVTGENSRTARLEKFQMLCEIPLIWPMPKSQLF